MKAKKQSGKNSLKARIMAVLAGIGIVGSFVYISFNMEQFKDNYINTFRPFVFKVTNLTRTTGGTGFLIKAPSGHPYLLTNGHVCGLATEGRVLVSNIDSVYNTIVLYVYEKHDLCLIAMPRDMGGFTVANEVERGDNITVLGYPGLEPLSLVKGQINDAKTIQIVVGINMPCVGEDVESKDPGLFANMLGVDNVCLKTFQTVPITAPTYPGNSGSPVLNKYGKVVGVIFAGNDTGGHFTIPLSFIKDFLAGK